ncbi:MAG TPA: PqqD family protein [Longimicrobiaceae bacterium]
MQIRPESTTAHRIRPSPEVVFTRVSDTEGILLSIETKRYYSLNETGMRIWEALERSGDVATAVEALVAEYEVTSEAAAALVAEFVALLREEGLVGRRQPG